MGSRKIKRFEYGPDGPGCFWAEVGIEGVTSISEHFAQGEGDRWHYDIHYENGEMLRIFNPREVLFGPEEKDEFDIGDLGPPLHFDGSKTS